VPGLAPMPVRPVWVHGQIPLRLGAFVLPVRHLPGPAPGLAGHRSGKTQGRDPQGLDSDSSVECPDMLRVGAPGLVAHAAVWRRQFRDHIRDRRLRFGHYRDGARLALELRTQGRGRSDGMRTNLRTVAVTVVGLAVATSIVV